MNDSPRPVLIAISGKVFAVEILSTLSMKDDGFSGIVFRAQSNGKTFRLPFERFSFVVITQK